MKKYLVFAGVNGAGKTTLFQANSDKTDLPRVNMDEIVRNIGSWKNSADTFKAGKIAVKLIKEYFDKDISFNQETTLCGRSILNNINKAKNLGYEVELWYVGLESAELAISRVEQRVRDGGHGIPSIDIKRRYIESLDNLRKVIPISNRVIVYDNTKSFIKIASFVNGKCTDSVEDIPMWFHPIMENYSR